MDCLPSEQCHCQLGYHCKSQSSNSYLPVPFDEHSILTKPKQKLGGIPVGMRQYTSNVLVVPDSTGACGLASINGLIIVSEGCTTNRVLVHEFAHEMDTFALDELDQGYRYSLTKRLVQSSYILHAQFHVWRHSRNNSM